MNRFEIQSTLERIREARTKIAEANRDINTQAARSMRRLLFEAAMNRMSVDEVAKASGYTKVRIRAMMRKEGIDPRWSKTLLAAAAAEALAENAELLGIDPVDMDLMSPLAYLPAGERLRKSLDITAQRGVTELEDEEPVHTLLYDMVACDYYEDADLPGVIRLAANGGTVTCDGCIDALEKTRA